MRENGIAFRFAICDFDVVGLREKEGVWRMGGWML